VPDALAHLELSPYTTMSGNRMTFMHAHLNEWPSMTYLHVRVQHLHGAILLGMRDRHLRDFIDEDVWMSRGKQTCLRPTLHAENMTLCFACAQNVSSNAGEHAHQEHCKAVFSNTNRHPDDWQRQMMMHQCRLQASNAISRQFSGKCANHDCMYGDSVSYIDIHATHCWCSTC
jgi:hypothetical protein